MKFICIEFGSALTQDGPVHTPLPMDKMVVFVTTFMVWAPAQAVPSEAEAQVKVSFPVLMVGPPTGVKSAVAFTVIVPDPTDVVRARYCIVMLPRYETNVLPEVVSERPAGTESFPLG